MVIAASTHPDLARIVERVHQARLQLGLTQTQLAGLAGTGLRFISELERGKATIGLHKLLAVLSALGLRLEVLDGAA